MGRLARRIFGMSLDEVTFARRGFRGGEGPVREHVEKVGVSFLAGFHLALEDDRPETLIGRLEEVENAFRGFAYEGAAMSIALLDVLQPWRRRRFPGYVAAADGHVYMIHVGAGWAMARLPFGMRRLFDRLDPLLRWLALDGYGFHQGYFHWPRSVTGGQEIPRRVRGYGRRVFDQGLGRSLWFVDGADVERIPATIASFPAERRPDLWAGIGLSSTYAGGVPPADLEHLRDAAGPYLPQLSQGSAFAVEARLRAGNLTEHAETASRVFCDLPAAEAAELTRRTRPQPVDDGEPAYETWRRRIQHQLVARPALAAHGG